MMQSDKHTIIHRLFISLGRWIDSEAGSETFTPSKEKKVDWLRVLPFLLLHLACLGVVWVGWSWTAIGCAAGLYLIRMFAITGFYHRYFSHRTYKTSRFFQFIFAVLGNSASQRGPLWWAGHHRHHHRFADSEVDVHSPSRHGFLWSHMGWITSRANFPTPHRFVGDLRRFPELCWLNRFDIVAPTLLAVILFLMGHGLSVYFPESGTTGIQMVVWGFFISTVLLFHGTCTINSLSHMFGTRRYDTPDTSRNNFLLSIITLGEGWHNNHHHYPITARQGFFWWEMDITYYVLWALARLGIIWDLRPLPKKIRTP